MKSMIRILVGLSLFFLLQPFVSEAEAVKVGVVDFGRFQENSSAFKKIRDELAEKYRALKAKLNKEKEALVEMEEEIKKQSVMLSLDAKEDKQMEYEKKRRYIKYLQEEYTQDMKHAEREARERVGKEIEEVVREIGEKEGYTLILEKGTLGLLYYTKKVDITDQIIKAYDRSNR